MNLKNLMVIKAVVCLVLGLPILLLTVPFYTLFGATLAPGGIFAAREYGASLVGNMLLTWFARKAVDSDARRAIILGLCVYDAIGFIVTLISIFTGALGPLGWFAAAVYLFFALGFGYFLLPSKKAA
jgi:hypothetical protein